MIRFLLVFGVLAGISRLDSVIAAVREPYCELLARSLSFTFSLTSLNALRLGSTITVGFGDALTIIPSCDGVILLVLFVAGAAAIPIQPTLRPYAWAFGCLVLLTIVNWFRLVILAMTSFFRPTAFETIHTQVMQGVLIVIVAVLFLVWLSFVDAERSGARVRTTSTTEPDPTSESRSLSSRSSSGDYL